jgi:hypothetical protein
MDLDEVATRLGSVTDGGTISRLPQLLAGDPHWEAIATAVTRRGGGPARPLPR